MTTVLQILACANLGGLLIVLGQVSTLLVRKIGEMK